jgi:hypothetical protein
MSGHLKKKINTNNKNKNPKKFSITIPFTRLTLNLQNEFTCLTF